MLRLAILASALSALAAPAVADEAVARGLGSASLHDGPLEMQAACAPAAGGGIEVSATFAPRHVTMMAAPPTRMILTLGEGDDVAVAVPGYPQVLYRFLRSGPAVTMSVRDTTGLGPVASGL